MRVHALAVAACTALVVSCTDDLDAPYNYQQIDDSESATTGDPLAVDCGDLGNAAVGAAYMRSITASGGEPPYQFSATAVPAGLALDTTTGAVSGVPTTVGSNSVDVTVTDAGGASEMASCPLDVGPQLAIEPLALDAVPYCITGADTLLAHVAPGTGDGSPITCDTPMGSGDGKVPAGVSVDPTSCAIVGVTNETRLGTWAFMVRGTQSGVGIYIPYCVTQATPAPGTFDIEVDHTGMTSQTLVPLLRTFNPNGSIVVGGGDDPLFTITDPGVCPGNFCSYGYNYFINASPFDANSVDLEASELVRDMMNQPIGFLHRFQIDGPVVPDAFKTRPWIVNLDFDYCLSETMTDCDGAAISANANGFLEFSVIMVPMPP